MGFCLPRVASILKIIKLIFIVPKISVKASFRGARDLSCFPGLRAITSNFKLRRTGKALHFYLVYGNLRNRSFWGHDNFLRYF